MLLIIVPGQPKMSNLIGIHTDKQYVLLQTMKTQTKTRNTAFRPGMQCLLKETKSATIKIFRKLFFSF